MIMKHICQFILKSMKRFWNIKLCIHTKITNFRISKLLQKYNDRSNSVVVNNDKI